MPTNANAFNTRVTTEALEKRFRDTFTSQAGAELIDDLYASGVIVPVVDFTAAAEGSVLPQYLQRAWDFSTGHSQITNTTSTIVSTSGFWQLEVNLNFRNSGSTFTAALNITDGLSTKPIWEVNSASSTTYFNNVSLDNLVIFLRAGDSLTGSTNDSESFLNVSYRQVADVSGNLVDPSGFTSS